jgi:hypothetical protein
MNSLLLYLVPYTSLLSTKEGNFAVQMPDVVVGHRQGVEASTFWSLSHVLLFAMHRGLALAFDFAGDVSPICHELHDDRRAVVLADKPFHALFRCSRNLDS